jgi:DNA-binding transcriptional LysR family regulator
MEDRLRKFVQVVDSGNFSRAATTLHVSQPALTTAIKKLERELGAVLLERQAKHLTLTAAGEIAYRAAKDLNARVLNLRYELAELAGQKPLVRLGLIDSIADILASEGRGFATLKQATDLSVVINNSRQLILATAREQLEAAIIIGGTTDMPDTLAVRLLGQEPLALVVHPADRQYYEHLLRAGRLPNFLSYHIGSHSQYLIEKLLAENRIIIEPTFYSTSPEVMLKMVISRQGVAMLPYALVKPQLLDKALVRVSPGPTILSRPIYTIQLLNRLLPEALEQTLTMASTSLEKLMAEALDVLRSAELP